MPRVNIQEAVEKFRAKLDNGYSAVERSKNTEEDYSIAKEDRDTNAVRGFVSTPCFEHIKSMK